MAEAIQYMFDHQEVAELLVKKQGLHEGQWMLSIELVQAAVTVPTQDGKTVMPAALSIVQRIGLKKHDGPPLNLTVDASIVNPRQASKESQKKSSKRGAKK
jgi:hypothetical protein